MWFLHVRTKIQRSLFVCSFVWIVIRTVENVTKINYISITSVCLRSKTCHTRTQVFMDENARGKCTDLIDSDTNESTIHWHTCLVSWYCRASSCCSLLWIFSCSSLPPRPDVALFDVLGGATFGGKVIGFRSGGDAGRNPVNAMTTSKYHKLFFHEVNENRLSPIFHASLFYEKFCNCLLQNGSNVPVKLDHKNAFQ